MFGFGLVTICQGLVQNYGGLITTRFFLGVFESGMFPGSFYLIGMWYKRHEAQKRYTFFFASTTLAGAFGGLLASAIGKMDGMKGYSGWRWIFILEGVLTCVVSFAWFFVSNFPVKTLPPLTWSGNPGFSGKYQVAQRRGERLCEAASSAGSRQVCS